ncbi:hypothetical protein DRJ17_04620 [Candidatus Woesearchaeota archaeon]|nr:MAG: hypothetical protein DRJ17_04620 [Candidatus Woesearchaeota archaeon]
MNKDLAAFLEEAFNLINEGIDKINKNLEQIYQVLKEINEKLAKNEEEEKWHKFKTGTGEWAFSNDFPELKRILQKKKARGNNFVEIDGYRYRLSGDNDRFIQRYPISKAGDKK